MAAFHLAPLQVGLQGCETISATTALCWHMGSFLSLSSSAFDVHNSGRVWFILRHNICLCELFPSGVTVVLLLLRKIIPTLNGTEDFPLSDCVKKWPWKSALKCLSRILRRHLAIVISIPCSWNLLCKLDERLFQNPFLDFSPQLHSSKVDPGFTLQRKWIIVNELGRRSLLSHW